MMNELNELPTVHAKSITRWKEGAINFIQEGFLALAEENHAFNYQLWHAEDKARRDDKGPQFVYEAKRAIDGFNQQRNNRMESMDAWLHEKLNPAAPHVCTVHSETPGMMIDRLSILALKAYHMAIQTKRSDVDKSHLDQCQQKLQIITAQQQQLYACLQQFIREILTNQRTFCVYHQFKMYNDPALNPELYTTQ